MFQEDVLSIYGSCGEFAMSLRDWLRMLALAQRYGWQPEGTAAPDEMAVEAELWEGDPAEWDGSYFPSYGQQVSDSDAKELATALEHALPDIPDHDAIGDRACESRSGGGWLGNVPEQGVNPLEAFSGGNKEFLINFIAHCREDEGLWMY